VAGRRPCPNASLCEHRLRLLNERAPRQWLEPTGTPRTLHAQTTKAGAGGRNDGMVCLQQPSAVNAMGTTRIAPDAEASVPHCLTHERADTTGSALEHGGTRPVP